MLCPPHPIHPPQHHQHPPQQQHQSRWIPEIQVHGLQHTPFRQHCVWRQQPFDFDTGHGYPGSSVLSCQLPHVRAHNVQGSFLHSAILQLHCVARIASALHVTGLNSQLLPWVGQGTGLIKGKRIASFLTTVISSYLTCLLLSCSAAAAERSCCCNALGRADSGLRAA